jgi:hypothetical protein
MRDSISAADLLSFRLCTGQCLLGLEDECVCRCRGVWHAALAEAEVVVPEGLTLGTALAGGPAGAKPRYRSPAKRTKGSRRTAAILKSNPDISGAELGRRLGVSERQGRRLLAQVASAT